MHYTVWQQLQRLKYWSGTDVEGITGSESTLPDENSGLYHRDKYKTNVGLKSILYCTTYSHILRKSEEFTFRNFNWTFKWKAYSVNIVNSCDRNK